MVTAVGGTVVDVGTMGIFGKPFNPGEGVSDMVTVVAEKKEDIRLMCNQDSSPEIMMQISTRINSIGGGTSTSSKEDCSEQYMGLQNDRLCELGTLRDRGEQGVLGATDL